MHGRWRFWLLILLRGFYSELVGEAKPVASDRRQDGREVALLWLVLVLA